VAAFLCQRFSHIPPAVWAQRLSEGVVLDEQGLCVDATRPYQAHTRVFYYRQVEAEAPAAEGETLLFQDAHLVVADKPHFMPVTPGGACLHTSLLLRLRQRLNLPTLTPMHRIDRDTAGVVVFLVQPAHRGAYHALFGAQAVHKHYEAVVHVPPGRAIPEARHSRMAASSHFMQMQEVPGEPNAHTHIECLGRAGDWAWLGLQALTGRRHQLRLHCAALGLPIANDRLYPVLQAPGTDDPQQPLQLLARRMAFQDPITGQERAFESQRRLHWPRTD